jgi:hypothetical protein
MHGGDLCGIEVSAFQFDARKRRARQREGGMIFDFTPATDHASRAAAEQ